MTEPTQPKIFHIHIDAQFMTAELHQEVTRNMGFYDSNFGGHPEGYVHFEPQQHLTLKLNTKQEFDRNWDILEETINKHAFRGYIEGEYIPIDEFIPYKKYKEIPVPYMIHRRKLEDTKNEEFRQTEVHITLEKDKSNPELIKKLLNSGLYGAYVPKKHGTFLVLTIQGYLKHIVPFIDVLRNYLLETGGAYLCTIKEERALKFKKFDIENIDLPEIADYIDYHDFQQT